MTTPVLDDYAYGLRVRRIDGDTVIGHSGTIAGFNSVMEAHMNDGYGIVLLTNGRPSRELAHWILDAVKAAMRNQPLPEKPAQRTATRVDNAREWATVYRSTSGEAVEFVDVRDRDDLSVLTFEHEGEEDQIRQRSADGRQRH